MGLTYGTNQGLRPWVIKREESAHSGARDTRKLVQHRVTNLPLANPAGSRESRLAGQDNDVAVSADSDIRPPATGPTEREPHGSHKRVCPMRGRSLPMSLNEFVHCNTFKKRGRVPMGLLPMGLNMENSPN